MKDLKHNVVFCSRGLLIITAILALYIVYITVFGDYEDASLNRRSSHAYVERGRIIAADGQILASGNEREYPFGSAAVFVTGYRGQTGVTGIEKYADNYLSGVYKGMEHIGAIGKLLLPRVGFDVCLTIDPRIQQIAYDALAGQRGAAILLNAQTGAIVAMVSSPAANPNNIDENFAELNSDDNAPLVNRALNGLYPPGSVIKPIIADAVLTTGVSDEHEVFNCTGSLDVGGGYSIGESHGSVHGRLHLNDALVQSCNVTFGTLGMRLGEKGLLEAFRRFGLDNGGKGEVTWSKAYLPLSYALDDGDVAQLSIGQSYLMVSPMSMALVAASFANNGVVMKPYLIERVVDSDGDIVTKVKQEILFTATDTARAGEINGWLLDVVAKGTGQNAQISGVPVAGKTGTAQNPSGDDHSWFIGWTNVNGQHLAFAVIVENGGSGADTAAPLAKKIISGLLP